MKNKIIVIGLTLLILLIGATSFLLIRNETKKEEKGYVTGDVTSALLPMVEDQKEVNEKLEKIVNSNRYTFESAYVEANPYKISPLSAIIIFQTNEEKAVDVYINGVKFTTMEASTKHVIPLYGLFEDYENVIKLVIDDQEVEYKVVTQKSNIEYPLNVEYKSETLNSEELYFTVASYATWLTGWDIEGHLRFYLTVDNRMDVEWLDNGHFLIGTSQGQFAENFAAFVEMDYLGKIYNYYVPSNGYSFEFQVLENGNYMLAGGNKPVYIGEQVIYEINPNDGTTVNLINVSEIIKNIDPNFDPVYLGQKAIRNSFYYNEEDDSLLVSFRGWDAVLSLNFKEKKLNWIFTDPSNELFENEVWKDYLVTTKNGRYPGGQHSVFLTSDGNVAFFDNGYNRLHGFENGGNDLVSFYKDNYSSASIYKIKNGVATLTWEYDANKTLFSHQYGYFTELENGNLLMDFGYNLKDEYRKTDDGTLSQAEQNPDNIYAKIIEVDKKKNVVFSATCEEGKFRAFKHTLYNKDTQNVDVAKLGIFETLEEDKFEKIDVNDYELDNAIQYINTISFTKNHFKTDYSIEENDSIELLFVSSDNSYKFTYKDSSVTAANRIFNLTLPEGTYQLYIKINDTIYSTDNAYRY